MGGLTLEPLFASVILGESSIKQTTSNYLIGKLKLVHDSVLGGTAEGTEVV